jgi:hypothetical protein
MDKTIQMARESWIDVYGLGHDRAKFIEALKNFEALVRADEREETNRRANASWTLMCEKMVAAEREACAKLCDAEWSTWDEKKHGNALADAIRARGKA